MIGGPSSSLRREGRSAARPARRLGQTDGLPDPLMLRSAGPRPDNSDGRFPSLAASSGRLKQTTHMRIPVARRGPGRRELEVGPCHPPHFPPNPNHSPTTPCASRWPTASVIPSPLRAQPCRAMVVCGSPRSPAGPTPADRLQAPGGPWRSDPPRPLSPLRLPPAAAACAGTSSARPRPAPPLAAERSNDLPGQPSRARRRAARPAPSRPGGLGWRRQHQGGDP